MAVWINDIRVVHQHATDPVLRATAPVISKARSAEEDGDLLDVFRTTLASLDEFVDDGDVTGVRDN